MDTPSQPDSYQTNGGHVTPQWTDERLNDMLGRLERVEPVVLVVTRLEEQMRSLGLRLEDNTKAQREQTALALEPYSRKSAFWGRVGLLVLGSCISGAFILAGALLAGVH